MSVMPDESTRLRSGSPRDPASPSDADEPSRFSYGTHLDAVLTRNNHLLGNNVDDDEQHSVQSDDETENRTLSTLTTRLRCLFAVITWPIVPTGTLAFLALLWFLYALLLDINKPCSRPLKSFAAATIFWIVYVPTHTSIRAYLFSYDRSRDGPNRPLIVRRYDQIFHTLALLYVYAGITLVQTCRGDEDSIPAGQKEDVTNSSGARPGTCTATCPNLYPALSVYVAALEIFTLSLILPLLCLPCVYLWFLRQVTADQEALNLLQERFREEEETLLSGAPTVSAGDIIDQLETVQLIRRKEDGGQGNTNDSVWIISKGEKLMEQGRDARGVHDCAICMSDFQIKDEDERFQCDIESGEKVGDADEEIVRATKCDHLFHQQCIARWIGGRWQGNSNPETSSSWRRRRAKRTTCPLCRRNLQTGIG
ncbi:hypothetical protein FisN_4Hh387 [Fistulifera solaris]|uniref:RING-type domain-containing protein n=1 Tax=Fistulifera solaris TaxID=1519565 RepID=A0A1Z5KQQ4_FISSO|nr:hypothetical protein FisN_4Hh387 [Fistulifera solaris]|eukprot:GAX28422.1 hypothetical protein FisN_4Hh387 [Fistulifera solaris]